MENKKEININILRSILAFMLLFISFYFHGVTFPLDKSYGQIQSLQEEKLISSDYLEDESLQEKHSISSVDASPDFLDLDPKGIMLKQEKGKVHFQTSCSWVFLERPNCPKALLFILYSALKLDC